MGEKLLEVRGQRPGKPVNLSTRSDGCAPTRERYSCHSQCFWSLKPQSKFAATSTGSTTICYDYSSMANFLQKATICSWVTMWTEASRVWRRYACCWHTKSSTQRTSFAYTADCRPTLSTWKKCGASRVQQTYQIKVCSAICCGQIQKNKYLGGETTTGVSHSQLVTMW